jgi:sensor domain CHASE-containing protein
MILFGETTPMPTPSMTVDPNSVTPGFAGFAIIVLIVAVVVLLIWDMNRRIRRVRYREEVREELDAEEAALRDQIDGDENGR